MSNITSERFARKLWTLYDTFGTSDFDIETFSTEVMNAFLEFGSETPCNRKCWELIELDSVPGYSNPWVTNFGFKVKGISILVGDILHVIEGFPIPDGIIEAFPELKEEQWKAVMRMAVMIVMAFSRFIPRE